MSVEYATEPDSSPRQHLTQSSGLTAPSLPPDPTRDLEGWSGFFERKIGHRSMYDCAGLPILDNNIPKVFVQQKRVSGSTLSPEHLNMDWSNQNTDNRRTVEDGLIMRSHRLQPSREHRCRGPVHRTRVRDGRSRPRAPSGGKDYRSEPVCPRGPISLTILTYNFLEKRFSCLSCMLQSKPHCTNFVEIA